MTARSDILPGWWPKAGFSRGLIRWLTPAAVLLIIVAGLSVHLPSLNGEFLMDDDLLIVDNALIKSWSHATRLFTGDIGAGIGISSAYFRPLQMLSYLVGYHIWQLDARAYHAVNVFFHLLAALSLFWLTGLLSRDRLLPLATALLFVVHPVQAESVACISGLGDCQAGLFVLLTVACYIKYLENGRRSVYGLTLLCLAAALLSKETGVVLPGLLALCHVYYRKSLKSAALAGTVVVLASYVVFRISIMENPAAAMQLSAVFDRIPGVFAAIAGYVRILIFPFHLHMGHDVRLFAVTDPPVITGLAATGLMIIAAVLSFRRRSPVFFAISWFFITLLPVSNLFPLSFYMADHYLYLPSVSFFLILAYLLTQWYRSGRYRRAAAGTFAVFFFFYAFLGFCQNDYWRTAQGFYERTLRYAPDSARMNSNLAKVYARRGDYDRAVLLYNRAISSRPDLLTAHYNLGIIYNITGKPDKSMDACRRALAIDPRFTHAYNLLGVVYGKAGQWDQAEEAYRQAIATNAANAAAMTNLAVLYFQRGDQVGAVELLRQAIQIDPTYAMAYHNLGQLYRQTGDLKKAAFFLKKATALQGAQSYQN